MSNAAEVGAEKVVNLQYLLTEGDVIVFMGRQNELKKLDELYNSGKFECVIVHGRLRVGKTALLREFMKNKRSIYFAAQETSSRENLQNLVNLVKVFSREPETQTQAQEINSYTDVFNRIFWLTCSERVVLIIDDYELLAASHRGISELIRGQVDQWFIESRLMLVICGSSEPVMERETLNYDSPFQGCRTAQIRLQPFTFFETRRYYTNFSPYDIAIIYGVTGGIPRYLELMDPDLPIERNIRRAFFDTTSLLFEEPANILRREVHEPGYFSAVLKAIATGCNKISEIAAAVGLETNACTVYLKNLIALGFVGKHTPVTEKAGEKTIYEIEDSMFRFWYRFVPDNISLIQSGMTDKIWRSVSSEISLFMHKVFEDICRQWVKLRNSAGRLPVEFAEVGRWWGIDPMLETDVAIPIVAYLDDSHALFGDCVWSDEQTGEDVLAALEDRSRLFRHPNRYLFLFSRSGFTDECAALAQRIGANLVMFE